MVYDLAILDPLGAIDRAFVPSFLKMFW